MASRNTDEKRKAIYSRILGAAAKHANDAAKAREKGVRPLEPSAPAVMTTAERIEQKCADIRDMLQGKNALYGDSALKPARIFSKASSTEQLLVRIDDKISRLQQGTIEPWEGEDTVLDLVGYLVMLLISRDIEKGWTPGGGVWPE